MMRWERDLGMLPDYDGAEVLVWGAFGIRDPFPVLLVMHDGLWCHSKDRDWETGAES